MPVPCVLVVDDDPEIRSLLSIYLESLGFGCLEAGSGKEALRILETRTIHAIISDLEMPGMTGTELYARIQHAWARLAQYFVLMTGSATCRPSRAIRY